MLHHIRRATKILIVCSLVVIAAGLTAIRLLLPEVQQYQQRIEQELSKALGVPVRVGEMGANMRGFQPELVLTDIAISETEPGTSAIKLEEIRMSINLLTALGNADVFSAGRVTLVGAQLYVTRKPDGSIAIEGLKSGDEKPLWLLRGGDFEVIQSQITWHDEFFNSPPRTYKNIDIAINNNYQSEQHTIHIRVNPSSDQPSALRLSLQLTGDIFSKRGITGQVYIEGSSLEINNFINDRLPMPGQMTSGLGDIKFWGRWEQSRLLSLAGYIGITNARLARPNQQDFTIAEVTSNFSWQRHDQAWRLNLSDFTFNDGQKQWPKTDLSLAFDKTEGEGAQIGLAVANLDLEEIQKIGGLIVKDNASFYPSLKQFQGQGIIKDLLFYTDTGKKTWAINGFINQLQLQAVGNTPGVNNLSGYVKGNHESGTIALASTDLSFTKPGLFRESLAITKLKGEIDWQHVDQQWSISSDDLILDTPVLKTRNRLSLTLPDNLEMDKAILQLQSQFSEGDLPAMNAYWPTGVISDELAGWLDSAYLAGRVSQGQALFYGAIEDYPFGQGNGIFEVEFDTEGVELDYLDDWPHFIDFDAHIHYRNDSMTVTAKHWLLNGVTIIDTLAKIPSLERSELMSVNATMQGKIQHSLGFLQRTPLKAMVTPVTELLTATGNTTIDVQMQLPLTDQASAKVDGVAKLSNAQLKILSSDLLVSNLVGDLNFNERGVFTKKGLKAEALGYPIRIGVDQQAKATKVAVDGRTDVIKLQDFFPNSAWKLARGQIKYDLDIILPTDPLTPGRIDFFSDLKEVSLLVPGALAKTVDQVRPLKISAQLDDAIRLPIRINYADRLKTALVFDYDQQQLHSAELLFGNGQVNFQQQGVMKLKIDQSKLALDSWLALSDSNEPSNLKLLDRLNVLEVDIGRLYWQDQNFKAIKLYLNKPEALWQGSFASVFAAGQVTLPATFTPESLVNLNLDFIDLTRLNQINADSDQTPANFTRHSQLHVSSKKFIWRSVDLGVLNLDSVVEGGGARIKSLVLNGNGHKLSLQGNWFNRKDELRTLVKGQLEVDDLGDLLNRLDISKEMQGSKSLFDFSLRWPGAPYHFDLATVQGIVDMSLQQGSLLGIEPGVGRILGAFDLTEWKRRISLDFSDIVAEGLAYNSITGLYYVAEGNAETDNLVIEGVSAKIEVAGRTGFVAHDYDQIVTVTPKTTAVIPFAGTIAGLVVKTITGSHPDSLTRTQYGIKGSWEQPEVLQLRENDGVLRKAWTGITDFTQTGDTEKIKEEYHE